jgi:DNA-binding transcriptional LysR family regulator
MPLPQPVPDLISLDLLVSVGELGSINAAAEVHGVTQPAASMRMRSLERVLGLQLLARTRTGSVLTPAGAATAEWASAVLRDMRALLVGASALRREGRRHLHLAASMTVAEYLLPPWLSQLAVASPEVTVSLEMGNTARVAELVAGREVEVGFIEGERPPGRLRAKDVQTDELVVVVGKRHPWTRRRKPLTVEALAANPLLMREPGSGTRDVLAAGLAHHGLTAQVLMELGSTTAIKAAAIAGAGPAVLSRLAVAAEVRSGELVPVPVEGLELRRTIRAIWASGRALAGVGAQLVAIAANDEVARQ